MLAGQQPPAGAGAGDSVRVWYAVACRVGRPCDVLRAEGTILRWTDSSFSFGTGPIGRPVQLMTAPAEGQRLRPDKRGRSREGMLIGAAGGAGLGAYSGFLVGAALCGIVSWGSDPSCENTTLAGVVGAALGALGGGAILGAAGAALGATIRRDVWVLDAAAGGGALRLASGAHGVLVRVEVDGRRIWTAPPFEPGRSVPSPTARLTVRAALSF